MAAAPSLKKYAARFWSLGISRVFLVLAIVFAVLALATPMWSTLRGTPGPTNSWESTTYGWTSRTVDEYDAGTLSRTTIEYYSGPGFDLHVLASALANSYLAVVVYVVLLAVLTVIFSTKWGNAIPRMGLLIIAVLAVLVALLALFYPIATVPSAAASDLGSTAITSYWGSTSPPPTAWGAGLGWWFLLVAALLGIVGGSLPYLRHMRVIPQGATRSWPPPR